MNLLDKITAQLEALPDSDWRGKSIRWTPELDAVLLKYWEIKPRKDVARILGLSITTCRERVSFLRDKNAGQAL